MNGQNPNNQLNQQGGTNVTSGTNSTVLGSVGPTPSANPTSMPSTTPTPNVAQTPPPQQAQPLGTTGVLSPQAASPTPATPPAPATPTNSANPTATPNVAPISQPTVPPAGANPQASVASAPTNATNTNVSTGSGVAPTGQTTNPQTQTVGAVKPQQPVAQPIPGTSGTPYQANSLTGNTVGVGTPSVGQDNLNANGFVEPNKNENIGTVPPPNNSQEKSKPKLKLTMNKPLFIIIVVVLIAAVAFGVYYFLSVSNKTTVNIKAVTIGVGETLSDNINDYATISGKDASSCTLNTRNVDTSTVGEYDFSITCGEDTYNGKIKVSDVTAPEVVLKTVYTQVNGAVDIDDFVESCTDPSECTTSFVNEDTVNNYLATAGGPYVVEINAADNAGNTSVVEGQLYVTENPIQIFKNCESTSTEVDGYQATKTVTDYLPMGRSQDVGIVYLGVSQRIYTYVFTNAEEYQAVVGEKSATITFDGVTGQASYNDEDLTLQILTDLSIDTLNSEAGGTFPTLYNEVDTYYKSLGYICNNILPNSLNQ